MHESDRQTLALLGKLNHAMGLATRDLLHNMGPDGRLPADQMRELARLLDDMSTLLDNAAEAMDPPDDTFPTVIDGSITDRPAGAIEPPPVAPAGLPSELARTRVHADIARLQDSAHRCLDQGLIEAAENFNIATAALADKCGCGECPEVPRASGAGLNKGEPA